MVNSTGYYKILFLIVTWINQPVKILTIFLKLLECLDCWLDQCNVPNLFCCFVSVQVLNQTLLCGQVLNDNFVILLNSVLCFILVCCVVMCCVPFFYVLLCPVSLCCIAIHCACVLCCVILHQKGEVVSCCSSSAAP